MSLSSKKWIIHNYPSTKAMVPLALWKLFCSNYRPRVHQIFCDQQDLMDHKWWWSDLIQDFDLTIQYFKGSMNTIVDALSHIREVNMLSFNEISSYLYDLLWEKYPDDSYFAKYWTRVEFGTNITTTSKESFHIANGLLYHNGKVCVPDLPEVQMKILF